jgi:hypothetical protein
LTLLELFVSSNFGISAPQCSTHYTADGRGDALDTAVHQQVRLSEIIVAEILDSVMFSILDPLDPIEKLTDWELFQNFASELLSTK